MHTHHNTKLNLLLLFKQSKNQNMLQRPRTVALKDEKPGTYGTVLIYPLNRLVECGFVGDTAVNPSVSIVCRRQAFARETEGTWPLWIAEVHDIRQRMGSGIIFYEYEKREKFEDHDMIANAELGTFKIRHCHFDDKSSVIFSIALGLILIVRTRFGSRRRGYQRVGISFRHPKVGWLKDTIKENRRDGTL
ncbi:hypothetical protein PIB30_053356 [Stylosanthes scabra]|uniref:Uncharacterized protein n=1 Tax=Stylosanthes scabra TaxID=79078 RepID=A0ABU6XG87_9FABA|nr:hypothetical protein [Stylosanthes scabra]